MMKALEKGSTVQLTREVPSLQRVVAHLTAKVTQDATLLAAVTFAVIPADEKGMLLSSEQVVFHNQPISLDGSTAFLAPTTVECRLPLVDQNTNRFLYVVYLDLPYGTRRSLKQLQTLTLELSDGVTEQTLLTTQNLAPLFTTETAVVMGELYRYKEEWRFRMLADGYTADLNKVLDMLGVK